MSSFAWFDGKYTFFLMSVETVNSLTEENERIFRHAVLGEELFSFKSEETYISNLCTLILGMLHNFLVTQTHHFVMFFRLRKSVCCVSVDSKDAKDN